MKIIMQLFYFIVGALIFLSLWGFYFGIRPFRITSSITPANFNVPYEDVSFLTKDNVLIRGWFIKSAKPNAKTIILLHGYPADKGDILPSMIFLHADYNLLLFDFRYLGKSGGRYSSVGKYEPLDLLAAIDYLHNRGINEVGVWGFSFGGAVALMTAPLSPAIKAVVAESAYGRLDWMVYSYYPIPILRYPLGELTRLWGLLFLGFDLKKVSPAVSASQLKIPILLVHARDDSVVDFKNALLLQDALKNNPHAQVIFVENLMHGNLIENHQKVIKRFFDDNLR